MKTYPVTGSANGIGKATSLRLGEAGDTAILNDLSNSVELQAVVEELQGRGVQSCVMLGDVCDPNAAAHAFEDLDRLDVLANNAGILFEAPITELSLEQWDRMIRVHLHDAFLFAREAAVLMKRQSSGAIINIASDFGQLGCADLCHYSAAKGASLPSAKRWQESWRPGRCG